VLKVICVKNYLYYRPSVLKVICVKNYLYYRPSLLKVICVPYFITRIVLSFLAKALLLF